MILFVTPRYNPSVTTMLAQHFEHQPDVRVIEDRRTKERRTKPLMMEQTRRRHDRRSALWAFKGAIIWEGVQPWSDHP